MIQFDRRTIVISIALLSLLALVLRLYHLSNQSLWMDEISSVATARVPLNQMVERSAQNNASPAYFLLLRAIVGNSNRNIEFKARILSALAGALSIPIFVAVVFLWRRSWPIALLAGLLLALNPLHLWYSQETRGYALMLFCGLCSVLGFELARESLPGQPDEALKHDIDPPQALVPPETTGGSTSKGLVNLTAWTIYILFAVLAAAFHKTGLVFPLTCALWDCARVVRERLRPIILAPHLVLVAIAALLLLETPRPPAAEYGRPNSILEVLYTGMTFVGGYSFGPSITEIQNFGAKEAVLRHPMETALIAAVLCLALLIVLRRARALLFGKEALLMIMGIGIVVLGGLLSHFPYNVRYALPALFGFLAIVAAFVVNHGLRALSRVAVAGILAINLWSDGQWFFARNYRKGDSRAVAAWLIEHRQQIKSWTVLPDYLGYSIKWYLGSEPDIASRYLPPTEAQTTSFPPVPDLLVIGRRHHLRDPDKVIAAYRSAVGQMDTSTSIAGFELYAGHKRPAGQ